MDADVVIIGAGVIGLAIASKISGKGLNVILLEKEQQFGCGISSRNTEVIHAGIYYQRGSLKASLCLKGRDLMYEHCRKYNVKHRKVGKIFIAVSRQEIQRLDATKKQAIDNGLDDLVELSSQQARAMEPAISVVAGLFSPSSGIVDSHGFMKSLLMIAEANGAIFAKDSALIGAKPYKGGWSLDVGGNEPAKIICKAVINAAGLYAIGLSKKVFPDRDIPKFYPNKGSYLRYSSGSPLNHIIYPSIVPGLIEERVDATPDMGGGLRFGPNVEEAKNLEDFSLSPGIVEKMSKGIKRYLPGIDLSRLQPDCSGIRPKIYGPNEPAADFRFDWAKDTGWLDLWGIESPGLTASLAIADYVYDMLQQRI